MNKYIRVKVSGKNSNYFINKLISKNILYSNLCIFSKYIEFDLDRKNYLKLIDIKTSYDICIVSYLGIYKYLFLYNSNHRFHENFQNVKKGALIGLLFESKSEHL